MGFQRTSWIPRRTPTLVKGFGACLLVVALLGCGKDYTFVLQDSKTSAPVSGVICEWFEGTGTSSRLKKSITTDSTGSFRLTGVNRLPQDQIVIESKGYRPLYVRFLDADKLLLLEPPVEGAIGGWSETTNSITNGKAVLKIQKL